MKSRREVSPSSTDQEYACHLAWQGEQGRTCERRVLDSRFDSYLGRSSALMSIDAPIALIPITPRG
jgi:hypothetical protein